ncbi:MAG TPA: PDZ domain-containing protein [Planctomycetaceae bacterium]|nr:PDZ domain-containing protein [Planctomycetaceae bacterium]
MDRWFWAWCGVVAALIALIFFLPDPTAQELSNLSNQQLLDLLRSPRSVVREAASGQLLHRSKTVVPHLSAAAMVATEDDLPAIMALLQELFLSSDPSVAEAAESALEELGRQPNQPLSDAAIGVLSTNLTLRHARAMAQIRQLGGQVRDLASTAEPIPSNVVANVDSPWLVQSHVFLLDHNWEGGDEGLKYLLRVYPFDGLALHLTRDAPVSPEAIQQLRTRRKRVTVRRQDESCLGVLVEDERQPARSGVRFSQVVTNSPAARAGLRRGDQLLAFNGRLIRTFSDLQQCAASLRPGERVDLRIGRMGATYHVKLPLGSDFGTGVCRCVADLETP